MPKLTFGDYWLELPTRFSKGQLTYLLYGKELSSSGSYLKLWVKKRLKISFDGKKKLENFMSQDIEILQFLFAVSISSVGSKLAIIYEGGTLNLTGCMDS